MAPVSMLVYPYFFASRAASVLFPEPAGPSMAITIFCAPAPALSMVASPLRLRWRRPVDQRSCIDGNKTQLSRRQQRVDRIADLGSRGHAGKELLDLILIGGNHRLQI